MPIYQDKKTGLYMYRTYIKNIDGTKTQKQKNGFKRKKDAKEHNGGSDWKSRTGMLNANRRKINRDDIDHRIRRCKNN